MAINIVSSLRNQGIEASDPDSHEIGNTILCKIGKRKYEVEVSFDWVTNQWWEVMYAPEVGLIARLCGANEETEMKMLTRAIDNAIRGIKGITEIRWYSTFPSNPEKEWSPFPVGA